MVKIRTRKTLTRFEYSQDDGGKKKRKRKGNEISLRDETKFWQIFYTKSCIVVAWRAKKRRNVPGEKEGGAVTVLTPFLEQAHSLAPAIWPPQIASAAGAVTAVFRPVVAVSTPWYAGPPKQVDQRGTSTRD